MSEGQFLSLQSVADPLKDRLTSRKAKTRQRVARHRAKERAAQRKRCKNLTAILSESTRERLINEALQHPLFILMDREHAVEFINTKIEELLSNYPWWFGHLAIDKIVQTRPATQAQLDALAKARQVKSGEAMQREQRLQERLAASGA